MKKIALIIAGIAIHTGAIANSYTMTPDGNYVSGSSYTMTPDGNYVGAAVIALRQMATMLADLAQP